MGLPKPIVEFLFAEAAHKSIEGRDVVFIGRQSVYASAETLKFLSEKYDVAAISAPSYSVTDKGLMEYFGAKSFRAIDVSDYEKADIIHDLNAPIPDSLHETADFVFDGSCLDNIFNPAEALKNISKLLRPGGRALLINHGTWFNGAYSIASPGWFHDFFVVNGYQDVQVYIGHFTDSTELHHGPMPIYWFNWKAHVSGGGPPSHHLIIVLAEKSKDSTSDRIPVQHLYRSDQQHKEFYNRMDSLSDSRRLFGRPKDLLFFRSPFIYLTTLANELPD